MRQTARWGRAMLATSWSMSGSVVVVLLAVVLSSCGSGSTESSEGPVGASSSSSSSATPSAAATETTTATPSEAQSAAPSAGPRLEIRGLALNVPEGWEIQPGEFSEAAHDTGPSGGQILTAATTAISGVETTDSLAKASLRAAKQEGLAPIRQDNRTVGGAEGYVVTGSNDLYPTWFEFGAVGTNGYAVKIIVSFVLELPPAETDGVIDSILTSVTYPPA